MSAKINIPSYLQPYSNEAEAVEVKGSTIEECLNDLVKQFPNMWKMVFTKEGELLSYASVYVDGDFAYGDDLARPVKDGDELNLIYIIGGG